MRTRLLMLLLIAAAIPAQAATIRVPQDQWTIPDHVGNFNRFTGAFTKNVGQWDERVLYHANADDATIWIAKDGIYYQFFRNSPKLDLEKRMSSHLGGTERFDRASDRVVQ